MRRHEGAALTAVPGIVFSGSSDGGFRAYATDDGTLIWSFDTNKEFMTVKGVKATGRGLKWTGRKLALGTGAGIEKSGSALKSVGK